MSVVSYENEMDLEKYVEIYEEEEIQLPGNSTSGKLVYFLAPYFFEKTWISNIIFPLSAAYSSSFVLLAYSSLRGIYDDQLETKLSDIFSPLWMIIHYFLCFTVFFVNFIYRRKKVNIETKVLQKLLKEVSEMDLTGDPVAWRRIASRINHFSKETGYHYCVFYGGGHCMNFFLREIVKPIKCQNYDIRCYYDGRTYRNFWEDPQNKVLIERAVANYQKSVENFDELSHTAEEDECRDDSFEKFCSIFITSMLYLVIIELASCMVMMMAFIISMISYAIFNSFVAPQ